MTVWIGFQLLAFLDKMGVKSINLTNLPKIMAQRDQQTFLASCQTIVLKLFLKVCSPKGCDF